MYIIGAGLSGLSGAINALKKKMNVEIYESAKFSGGRCRSFFDKKVNIEIDNGNHLVFSANENFMDFCKTIGTTNTLKEIPADFNFYDFKSNQKWNLDLSSNYLNLLLNKQKLIPHTKITDYFSLFKFFFVNDNVKVKELVGESKIFKTFWEPLTVGVMNTSPDKASAKVLSNVLKKTIFKGADYCKIFQPKSNWNKTLIEPSIRKIQSNGGQIFHGNLLKKIIISENYVSELVFINKKIKIKRNHRVLLCIPPTNLSKLVDNLNLPEEYNTILNLHFKIKPEYIPFFTKSIVGFINSITQWIFVKKDHLSVTVSDANYFNNIEPRVLVDKVWKEICNYLDKEISFESFQIVKEKKATYVQSPENINLVKNHSNLPHNLLIAGDWTQYNLPCTIEASILSGKKAIDLI